MKAGEYASGIPGVRFFRRKELEPVASVWEYQVDAGFTAESARRVFIDLPDGLEVCCVALEKKDPEEGYAFVRRVGPRWMLRRGGHGWLSKPEETALDQATQILLASPFVRKPDARFESFRVTQEK
jgi:hypothetical protein